jgi:hypothetical protein
MAKRKSRVPPARKEAVAAEDDSLLIRSAESLGRVIGSLQRQVQGSSKRVSSMTTDAIAALPELPRFDDVFSVSRTSPRKRTASRRSPARKAKRARKKTALRKAGGARKSVTRVRRAAAKK